MKKLLEKFKREVDTAKNSDDTIEVKMYEIEGILNYITRLRKGIIKSRKITKRVNEDLLENMCNKLGITVGLLRQKKKPIALSDRRHAIVLSLLDRGYSYDAVAEAMGRHRSNLYNSLKNKHHVTEYVELLKDVEWK